MPSPARIIKHGCLQIVLRFTGKQPVVFPLSIPGTTFVVTCWTAKAAASKRKSPGGLCYVDRAQHFAAWIGVQAFPRTVTKAWTQNPLIMVY